MRPALMLLTPRWLSLYVGVIAASVTMVLLGRWQWHVAHVRNGDIQNYAYAFQWWAFTIFALFMTVRLMRDALHRQADGAAADLPEGATAGRAERARERVPARATPAPVAYRRYVMHTEQPEASDPELAAYNAYLAGLADRNSGDR